MAAREVNRTWRSNSVTPAAKAAASRHREGATEGRHGADGSYSPVFLHAVPSSGRAEAGDVRPALSSARRVPAESAAGVGYEVTVRSSADDLPLRPGWS